MSEEAASSRLLIPFPAKNRLCLSAFSLGLVSFWAEFTGLTIHSVYDSHTVQINNHNDSNMKIMIQLNSVVVLVFNDIAEYAANTRWLYQ